MMPCTLKCAPKIIKFAYIVVHTLLLSMLLLFLVLLPFQLTLSGKSSYFLQSLLHFTILLLLLFSLIPLCAFLSLLLYPMSAPDPSPSIQNSGSSNNRSFLQVPNNITTDTDHVPNTAPALPLLTPALPTHDPATIQTYLGRLFAVYTYCANSSSMPTSGNQINPIPPVLDPTSSVPTLVGYYPSNNLNTTQLIEALHSS